MKKIFLRLNQFLMAYILFSLLNQAVAQEQKITTSPTTQQVLTTQSAKNEFIYYRNKPRSKVWFKKMFKKLRAKITIIDGKYFDLGFPIDLDSANSYGKVPSMGTLVNAYGCEVFQVLTKDEVLIRRPEYRAPPLPPTGPRPDIWTLRPRLPSYENRSKVTAVQNNLVL